MVPLSRGSDELPDSNQQIDVVFVVLGNLLLWIHRHSHEEEDWERPHCQQQSYADDSSTSPEVDGPKRVGSCLDEEKANLLRRKEGVQIVRGRIAEERVKTAPEVCDKRNPDNNRVENSASHQTELTSCDSGEDNEHQCPNSPRVVLDGVQDGAPDPDEESQNKDSEHDAADHGSC